MREELNFNFFNILIIAASVHGILFALSVLSLKKYKSASNFYLAQIVLYLSLSNLYYWFLDTKIVNSPSFYDYLYIPWNLLILPCYYFFVKTYLKSKLTNKEKRFFLSPFFLSLSVHFIILIHGLFFKESIKIPTTYKNFFYNSEEIFSIFFTTFFIYKTFLEIKKVDNTQKTFSNNKVPVNTLWLKNLLFWGIVICVIWLLLIVFNQFLTQKLFQNNSKYFLWLLVSALIYWLGYLGVYYSGIFNERQKIREDNSLQNEKTVSKKTSLNKSKFDEIDKIVKEEELYLNAKLSLDSLAEHFNLSTGYISQLFNEFSNNNFSTYINKLRIEKAKKLLTNINYKNYTIVAIALEVGFNSKSTFYNSFKKETGISPTAFRKQSMS